MCRQQLSGLSGLDTLAVWASLMVDHTAASSLQTLLEALTRE